MSKSESYKHTPIPNFSTSGAPMQYLILSDDGAIYTETSRAECLAPSVASNNPYQQRWYVDIESGLVVRLPRNKMGEDLARDNMRSVWRELKDRERWAVRTVASSDDDNSVSELPDKSRDADVAAIAEEKALLQTLYAALSTLTTEERNLITEIYWHGKTERQLAPELGLKEPKSVNKRKHRILDILRNNETLRGFFE